MSSEFPHLRPLEAFPHYEDGKTLVVLRDPTQISEQLLVVSPELFQLFPLFNGKNSVRDIQVELSRRQGRIVHSEEIARILQYLDDAHFLDTSSYKEYEEQILREFRAATVRSPRHAGLAYPSDAVELREQLDGFHTHPEGAGLPRSGACGNVKAIVAPHIDLRSGGPAYTHAFRALAESPLPDVFVILGTGHMGLPRLFSISNKSFETPLGTSEVDRDFLAAIREQLPEPMFEEDISHRNEHTIEFQLVFLHHLLAGRQALILPILCSFSYRDLQGANGAEETTRWFDRFVDGLRFAERQTGKRVTLIASVDFAHIGPRYGDAFTPDDRTVAQVTEEDAKMLEKLCTGDPASFFSFVAAEEDRRRICGFPALYTMLRLRPGLKGRVLCHRHTVMDGGGSFVTYGSMVFE